LDCKAGEAHHTVWVVVNIVSPPRNTRKTLSISTTENTEYTKTLGMNGASSRLTDVGLLKLSGRLVWFVEAIWSKNSDQPFSTPQQTSYTNFGIPGVI
jgi:hypothetical protein